MRIYVSGRQTGKTTDLLFWLKSTPEGVLIVHSTAEKYRLQKENPELKGRIHTAFDAAEGFLRGRRNIIIGIDNLDLILPALFGAPIGPVMMTREDDNDLSDLGNEW